MTILYPIGSFYPDQSGGPSNTLYWMTQALTKEGIHCIVLTTNSGIKDLPLNKYIDSDYGKVKYIKTLIHRFPFTLIWESCKQVHKADILHLTGIFSLVSLIVALYAFVFRKNIKIIWSPRGELNVKALNYGSKLKKIHLGIVKRIDKRMITFHATSEKEVQEIRKILGGQCDIIFLPNMIKLANDITLGKVGNDFLYVGRIHPIKNIEGLVEAFTMAHTQDVRLNIAGKGELEYEKSLQNLVKSLNIHDRVRFLGHIEGEMKKKIYCNAKYLILPSFTENFGNVVVEALQFGTPVIATKGTPWQILETYNAGYWVANDASSLANAIDEGIMLSEDMYQKMRKNARKLVEEQFDIESGVRKWIHTYNSVKVQ